MSEHKQSNKHIPVKVVSRGNHTYPKMWSLIKTFFGNPSFDCLQGAVNKSPARKDEISSQQLGITEMEVLKCD